VRRHLREEQKTTTDVMDDGTVRMVSYVCGSGCFFHFFVHSFPFQTPIVYVFTMFFGYEVMKSRLSF
jgi:hypothetical protein